MRLQTLFPSLLRYPSGFATVTLTAIGLCGSAPLFWSVLVPDPALNPFGRVQQGEYLLVADGALLALNLLGWLALLLACAQVFAWVNNRLADLMLWAGLAWSDARGILTVLMGLGAAGLLFLMIVVDSLHSLENVRESYALRAAGAWPEIKAVMRAEVPSDSVKVPVGDALPVLKQLLGSPAVGFAYLITPAGHMTFWERGGQPEVYELATWQPRHHAKAWFGDLRSPTERQLDRHDELVSGLAFGNDAATWFEPAARHALTPDEFYFSYRQGLVSSQDRWSNGLNVYEKAHPKRGRLGFRLSPDSIAQRLVPILAQHHLPGTLVNPHAGAQPSSLVLEAPWSLADNAQGWASLGILIDPKDADATLVALQHQAVSRLLLLSLFFCATLLECLRWARAMLGDRAIALAQSNFVSGVSHEMRTPLSTIKLYAELMQSGLAAGPAQQQEFLGTITNECERLSRLIENVIDFALISGRRRTYAFTRLDLNTAADEAVAAVAGPLAASGLELKRDIPAGLAFKADHDAIVQSLVNLLANGIKYAPEGGCLFLSAATSAEGFVAIAVKDFGPGIAPSEQKRIFKAFYRVDSEMTRTTMGSRRPWCLAGCRWILPAWRFAATNRSWFCRPVPSRFWPSWRVQTVKSSREIRSATKYGAWPAGAAPARSTTWW